MIPLKLRFTGLELDPMDLLQSRQLRDSPIPEEWTRIRFEMEYIFIFNWLSEQKQV
jgi:hypothetical protein